MSPALGLEALPFEVTRAIAAFVPAHDLLNLCRVSRTLRSVCYDGLVFRSCIQHDVACMSLDQPDRRAKPVDLDGLASCIGSDVQVWARFAVANSRARCLPDLGRNQPQTPNVALDSLTRFVPHLIVAGNEWLISNSSGQALSMLDRQHAPLFKRHAKDIASASTFLNRALDEPSSSFWLSAAALDALRFVDRRETNYMNDLFLLRMTEAQRNSYSVATFMGDMVPWAWLLYDSLDLAPIVDIFHHPQRVDTAARYPPTLQDMPWFGDLRNSGRIPVPFTTPSDTALFNSRLCCWNDWIDESSQRMREMLVSGSSSWVGYWSFGRHHRHFAPRVEFADAIEELTLSSPSGTFSDEPGTRLLLGTYPEHLVDFRLEGYVRPNGRFRLGPPGDFWACHGYVTPFGLFGFWGSADGQQSAGATWLWPASWTKESNKLRKSSNQPALPDSPSSDEATAFEDQ